MRVRLRRVGSVGMLTAVLGSVFGVIAGAASVVAPVAPAEATPPDGAASTSTADGPEAEPAAEAGPDAEAEPDADAGPDVDAEPAAEAGPDAAAAPDAKAEPDAAEPDPDPDPDPDPEPDPDVVTPAQDPPRIDGPYLGLVMYGGLVAVRVNEFDTGGAFGSAGGYLRFGQMVLPWLGLGLQGGGNGGVRSASEARQTVGQGGLLVDFTFVPAPKRVKGLSLRASFGFGGGAVRQQGSDGRSGFGGAMFGAGVRYEFFPGAKRYRATRGGGFGIGPELAWLGATPAARGRPMANTAFLGLSMTFYFGD